MRYGYRTIVALLALIIVGCGNHPLEIVSARELASLSAPGSVIARDGGASALIGGKIIWTFGDTLLNRKSVDGANMRSNTAALADPSAPFSVSEPLDANGAPNIFLPFTADEQAYNDATRNPNDRYALWPTSIFADGANGGIVFYLKLKVKGALTYEFIGTGIARVAINATRAQRDPDLLFKLPEPMFSTAFLDGSDVFVYGASNNNAQQFAVARVPLAHLGERDSYRFWNGMDWVTEVASAKPVLKNIPGAVSVSRNRYLQKYLAVHSEPLSNKILIQVADRPEGIWSDPVVGMVGQEPPQGMIDYAGIEHAELATNGGRTIIVSYYHPQDAFHGEMRIAQLDFK